ncbi:glycosyltransferase family 2 protein [Rhodococcus chondri]|uniref:Galactosyltransferase-related protein n=1 Tax=Rhodococcus chondri TaxID=3065941 RepID=A0ABU7JSY4_9NOCA|nr:galactosyltransferase-related protein [Rhodococcus sp. CC-R104]MEE2032950.1 galactosyltransferase-related protein [Rhodococcus sp. CC-R104]
MKVAVITVVAHRSDHLQRQLEGIARSSRAPDEHVIVSMGDPEVPAVVIAGGSRAEVVMMDAGPGRLPVAAARNLGADTALSRGAELLVFLDVDCIPAPDLTARYESAATAEYSGALLCGPVTYLPPPEPGGYDLDRLDRSLAPHPARPCPPDGEIRDSTDHELFWSLSFAVSADTWRRIGGFCTDYCGYGGEDTDFGQQAAHAGVRLAWVGGAHAFHQHHPVSSPPVEHLDDILANAALFHHRWGWWPMQGWLDEFQDMGLIAYDTATGRWVRIPSASSRS